MIGAVQRRPGARRAPRPEDAGHRRSAGACSRCASRRRKRVVQRTCGGAPTRGCGCSSRSVAIGAATLSVVFGIFALDDQRGGAWPFLLFAGAIVAAIVTLARRRGRAAAHRARPRGPRPPRGAAPLHPPRRGRSAAGAAEPERCAARGPARRGIRRRPRPRRRVRRSPTASLDPAVVLKLNERLLPYAVLFGLEREWVRELAALYEARGETPGWYSGRDGFNAGVVLGRRVVVLVGVEHVVVGVELELVVERVRRRRLVGRRRRRRRRRRRLTARGARRRRARWAAGRRSSGRSRRRQSASSATRSSRQVHAALGVDAGDLVGRGCRRAAGGRRRPRARPRRTRCPARP